jgi:hypothetical protein
LAGVGKTEGRLLVRYFGEKANKELPPSPGFDVPRTAFADVQHARRLPLRTTGQWGAAILAADFYMPPPP